MEGTYNKRYVYIYVRVYIYTYTHSFKEAKKENDVLIL